MTVGQPERATQSRLIALFRDELGYRYLGDWTDRAGNSNIEDAALTAWLARQGHTPVRISAALHRLRTEATNHGRTLYGNNHAVYGLLRYGVKEDEQDNTRFKLDEYLLKLCSKPRLLELIHDFVLFDGGVKKLPRVHQYFGIKAAQTRIAQRQGGIIWHTQGSGKSIVMVLLAKWILENNPNARVVILTDRDELDKQIEGVFRDSGETIYRTSSGRDLMTQLGKATPRLLCSLLHKFGRRDVKDLDAFIADLEAQPSATVGDVFVFVDECHRTQSGKLHKTMKALMPNAGPRKRSTPGSRPRPGASTIGRRTSSRSNGAPCRPCSVRVRAWSAWSPTSSTTSA